MSLLAERIAADVAAARGGAAFAEPWQARIFAVVTRLCDDGRYDWDAFKALLIDEVGRHGAPDGHDYYERWTAACERLLVERGLVGADELSLRKAHLAAHPPHPTHAAPGPLAVDPARRT